MYRQCIEEMCHHKETWLKDGFTVFPCAFKAEGVCYIQYVLLSYNTVVWCSMAATLLHPLSFPLFTFTHSLSLPLSLPSGVVWSLEFTLCLWWESAVSVFNEFTQCSVLSGRQRDDVISGSEMQPHAHMQSKGKCSWCGCRGNNR